MVHLAFHNRCYGRILQLLGGYQGCMLRTTISCYGRVMNPGRGLLLLTFQRLNEPLVVPLQDHTLLPRVFGELLEDGAVAVPRNALVRV
jgi:hypothetical protein